MCCEQFLLPTEVEVRPTIGPQNKTETCITVDAKRMQGDTNCRAAVSSVAPEQGASANRRSDQHQVVIAVSTV